MAEMQKFDQSFNQTCPNQAQSHTHHVSQVGLP